MTCNEVTMFITFSAQNVNLFLLSARRDKMASGIIFIFLLTSIKLFFIDTVLVLCNYATRFNCKKQSNEYHKLFGIRLIFCRKNDEKRREQIQQIEWMTSKRFRFDLYSVFNGNECKSNRSNCSSHSTQLYRTADIQTIGQLRISSDFRIITKTKRASAFETQRCN